MSAPPATSPLVPSASVCDGSVVSTTPYLPLPDIRPTMSLWPDAGRLLGLGRSATYNAAATGEIPTLRIGGKILVPTAALRRLVGVDQ